VGEDFPAGKGEGVEQRRGGYWEGNLGTLPLARPAGAPLLASASASP